VSHQRIPDTTNPLEVRQAFQRMAQAAKGVATDISGIVVTLAGHTATLADHEARILVLEGVVADGIPTNGFLFDTVSNDYLYGTDGVPLWNPT